jgi:hypothetical protein
MDNGAGVVMAESGYISGTRYIEKSSLQRSREALGEYGPDPR